ncbi:MAG: hypothetical protein NZ942_02005 [Candidatus Aenigmarchaeota archaeon]|nr:hypothetical protein [Candidatus Aenigmarchaeota archaeon]
MEVSELFKGRLEKEIEIKAIEIKKSEEVFGSKVKAVGRSVAVIYTEAGREAHAVPKGIEYKNGSWVVVDELQAIKSVNNPNSWFARFYKKYGKFPTPGMKVRVINNPRGFLVIDV